MILCISVLSVVISPFSLLILFIRHEFFFVVVAILISSWVRVLCSLFN